MHLDTFPAGNGKIATVIGSTHIALYTICFAFLSSKWNICLLYIATFQESEGLQGHLHPPSQGSTAGTLVYRSTCNKEKEEDWGVLPPGRERNDTE